jgi:hypothetical protein
MSFETWTNIGDQLSAVANSSAWCLGDWLVYGETTYNGRYREAVEKTALDYQTLRNYAWVARSFPIARRREFLSFGHHAEVAALPEVEQDFWLRKAEEFSWSRNHLRREVRASLRDRNGELEAGPKQDGSGASRGDPPYGEDPVDGATNLIIKVGRAQLDSYEQAASKAGLSLSAWAGYALEAAAQHMLDGR